MPTCRPRAKSRSAVSADDGTANLSANLHAKVDLQWIQPNYTFATPVLGGQLTVGMGTFVGRSDSRPGRDADGHCSVRSSLAAPTASTAPSPVLATSIRLAMLKWHDDVNNYMVYATGDIPVGAYDPERLANLGIGHGAIDGGVGYTYLNPLTGHEFSAVAGLPTISKIPTHELQERCRLSPRLGQLRSICRSRFLSAWSATFTISSRATAAPATA